MKVLIGTKGLSKTQQDDFPEEVPCDVDKCGGKARIAFVAYEEGGKDTGKKICDLHENEWERGKFWIHDNCSFAIYFCGKCCKVITIWNQG